MKKYFKKLNMKIKIFHHTKETGENFEQKNESVALNVLFASQNSEEITLVYKSEHNYN